MSDVLEIKSGKVCPMERLMKDMKDFAIILNSTFYNEMINLHRMGRGGCMVIKKILTNV